MKEPKRKKVLVVEDDLHVKDMICQLIQSLEERCDIVEASTGEEALSMVDKEKPDLIVLDIFLPSMNGFEFCQKVKGEMGLSKMKILAITGFPENDNIKKIYDSGADLCIMKPLHLDHFRQEVKRLLSD